MNNYTNITISNNTLTELEDLGYFINEDNELVIFEGDYNLDIVDMQDGEENYDLDIVDMQNQ